MRPEAGRPLRRFPYGTLIKLLLCAGNLLNPEVGQREDKKRWTRSCLPRALFSDGNLGKQLL